MPPKKVAKGKAAAKPAASKEKTPAKATPEEKPKEEETQGETKDEPAEPAAEPAKEEAKAKPSSSKSATPAKRKKATSTGDVEEAPAKSARRTGRSTPKTPFSAQKTLNFLLSTEARDLCRPKDETDLSKDAKTYTGTVPMSPFEELVSAVVLSRPISHQLGQRTIRTIFSPPHQLTTPKKLRDYGTDKLWDVLNSIKTQHKQKTVEQLNGLAGVVIEKFAEGETDTSLEKLRKDSEYDRDVMAETISDSIKGIGKTAVNIFARRVQGHWKEVYPYVDERTEKSLEALGLPTEAEDLKKLIDKEWKGLDKSNLQGKDDETKKRMAFVVILERAVGSDLEGKTDDMLAKI